MIAFLVYTTYDDDKYSCFSQNMQVWSQVLPSIRFLWESAFLFSSKYISLGVGAESNAMGFVATFHMVCQYLPKHVPLTTLEPICVCVNVHKLMYTRNYWYVGIPYLSGMSTICKVYPHNLLKISFDALKSCKTFSSMLLMGNGSILIEIIRLLAFAVG